MEKRGRDYVFHVFVVIFYYSYTEMETSAGEAARLFAAGARLHRREKMMKKGLCSIRVP